MGLFNVWMQKRNEIKEQRNNDCSLLILQLDEAINEINKLLLDKFNFIDPHNVLAYQNKWGYLSNKESQSSIRHLKKASSYKKLESKNQIFTSYITNIANIISHHNNQVARDKVTSASLLIGEVEGKKLDDQQMQCIVKEMHNHLVIAGAGTGKTTTIIGKIKYLLKSGMYKPEDILVLSFTNASAQEMKDRITRETEENIDASTFHKLGLNIITKANGIIPKITQISLKRVIKDKLTELITDKKYLGALTTYLIYNRVAQKSEFDFTNQAEYDEHLKANRPYTLNKEIVKSYGEMDIANFLFTNGVEYVYEKPYKVDTRTEEYSQYKPDFYLPNYEIYIEYFGIDKNGNVPKYFSGKNGKSAKQDYNDGIIWKRKIHKENETTLIESYSYEKMQGDLLTNLEKHLIQHNVKLSPKPPEELWHSILEKEDFILNGLMDLFETIINLVKSNNYTFDYLRVLNVQKGQNINANEQLIFLVEPLHNEYNRLLVENDEIDFNDMINLATKYITEGRFKHSYRYVIVDEYQDISKARFMLLQAMRNTNDYNLFCVGDDWQSIYRFAGSDIGFILNFSQYWGPAEISKIESTYRFSQKLIDVSGSFVMRNPMQIHKNIRGRDAEGQAIGLISGYTDRNAVSFLLEKLGDLPQNSTIFFIGRYSFDLQIIQDYSTLTCKYNNRTGMTDVLYAKRPDLKICFVTAHKSKGLQADYVFVINNKDSKMGFPSKIQDAPILELLLNDYENYPHAEERRLFYVALTRAKRKAIMLTVKDKESEFAKEIKETFADEIKSEAFECPLCGGRLVRKTGPYGDFLGCTNYKSVNCKYKRNLLSR